MKRINLKTHFNYLLICFLTLMIVLFSPSLKAEEEKLVVFNGSGGSLEQKQKEIFAKPFTEQTGINVIFTAPPNFAKLKAQVDSGNVEWDITEMEPAQFLKAVKLGYLEPIDYTIVDKSDLIEETINDYAIPGGIYSTVLAYSTEKFPSGNHPKSWADFWDVEKFPGRRSLRDKPYNNLEIALLADGVPPEKLYPLDVDRAFRSLDRIKPHIAVWWKVGAQSAQILVDHEVDMTTAWNGRISAIMDQGAPVAIEWNQNILMLSYYGVVKGAKHKNNAMKYLAFRLEPDRVAAWVKSGLPYPYPIKSLFKYVTPEVAKILPTYPENISKSVKERPEWWEKNVDQVMERWNAWIVK